MLSIVHTIMLIDFLFFCLTISTKHNNTLLFTPTFKISLQEEWNTLKRYITAEMRVKQCEAVWSGVKLQSAC